MAKREPKTLVIFRVWRNGYGKSDVIALFPTIPADADSRFCLSYEHIGQHGAAEPLGVVQATRPATKREAQPLLRELRKIGYNLQVVARLRSCHYEARKSALKAYTKEEQ